MTTKTKPGRHRLTRRAAESCIDVMLKDLANISIAAAAIPGKASRDLQSLLSDISGDLDSARSSLAILPD